MSDLGIIASGLSATQTLLADTAANLANMTTPGYGALQAATANLPAAIVRPPNTVLQDTGLRPDLASGNGTAPEPTTIWWSSSVQSTDVPTNLAITGPGFFAVRRPGGGTAYTRAGDFTLDAAGYLTLPDGSRLAGIAPAPPNSTVSVSARGTVMATSPGGASRVLGQIVLAIFANPGGLAPASGTLYTATAASGPPLLGAPGQGGRGTIQAGALNDSAANATAALPALIADESVYAANADALHVAAAVAQVTDQLHVS